MAMTKMTRVPFTTTAFEDEKKPSSTKADLLAPSVEFAFTRFGSIVPTTWLIDVFFSPSKDKVVGGGNVMCEYDVTNEVLAAERSARMAWLFVAWALPCCTLSLVAQAGTWFNPGCIRQLCHALPRI